MADWHDGVNGNWKPDDSHDMTKWYEDIRTPLATPRFYSVRECKNCDGEELKHAAGHFADPELSTACYFSAD